MKRMNDIVNRFYPPAVWDTYAALERISAIHPQLCEKGGMSFPPCPAAEFYNLRPDSVEIDRWDRMCRVIRDIRITQSATVLELWTCAGMCSGGIKVWCPDANTYRALGNTAVNVPFSEYSQPYDTFCVEIPDECAPKLSDDLGRPVVGVCRLDKKVGAFSCLFMGDAGTVNMNFHFAWSEAESVAVIEDRLSKFDGRWSLESESERLDRMGKMYVAPLNEDELTWFDHAKRAVMNACLVMSRSPHRAVPSNPERAEKLAASLAKKGLSDAARAANRRELSRIPTVFTIDRTVKLYTRGQSDDSTPSGYRTAPHWRRGHWAKYRVGAGRTQEVYRLRPAVLVNAELFGGDLGQTKTTYKGNGS